MFLGRFLAGKSPTSVARRLHSAAVAQGRWPVLYAEMDAPDAVEGRFEILTAHVILLIDRLKGAGPDAAGPRQALFDVYVSDLDAALREMGVGDLAVGKRMKALGEAFYGRARAYDEAFAALPDLAKLKAVVARTILAGAEAVDPTPLATYIARARASLAAGETDALLAGEAAWPATASAEAD